MKHLCSITLKWVPSLVIAGFLVTALSPLSAQTLDTDNVARIAMSTASLWMVEHHEHEIGDALDQGNLQEALEEAEELVAWIKGTPWLSELAAPSGATIEAAEAMEQRLKEGDEAGAKLAFESMQKKVHHLHHELMEVVGGEQGH